MLVFSNSFYLEIGFQIRRQIVAGALRCCILCCDRPLKHAHISVERKQFTASWNCFHLSKNLNRTILFRNRRCVNWIHWKPRNQVTLALTKCHVSSEHLCELPVRGICATTWLNPLSLRTKLNLHALHMLWLECSGRACAQLRCRTSVHVRDCSGPFVQGSLAGGLVTTAPVSGVLNLKCIIRLEGPYCPQIWALCSTEHFPGVLGTRANLAENDLLVNNSSSSQVQTVRKVQSSVNFNDLF